MTLIERIDIHAFKSIQAASLELGAFNVFVGANGSGKSNILEAIGVLGAAASGRVNDESLWHRGVRPGLPDLYKTSFRGYKRRNAIRFGAYSGTSSYAVDLNNPSDQSTAWAYKNEKWISAGQKIVGRSPASSEIIALDTQRGLAALKAVEMAGTEGIRILTALQDFSIYAPNTFKLRGVEPDLHGRSPVGLAGGRLAEASEELRRLARNDEVFEDVIEGILELIDWVDNFGARPASGVPLSPSMPRPAQVLYFRDRYMAEGRNILSGFDASEGALYVLFAAILATHPDSPKLLAIDNFDATLNPRLLRSLSAKMVDWVLESGRQVLLTCHNPLVLDGLPLQDDRVRLFAVDRSYGGMTVIRRVAVDDALMAKEGWPLSRLWILGHLGACQMFNVKLVCEGITDKIILEAVLFAYLQSDKFTVNCIQPESSEIQGVPTEHGTGWKGVRRWCQMIQAAGGLEEVRALASEVDLLIIHVDGEIVFEAEINAGQPCPPPEHNVIKAESVVMSWLGLQELPQKVLIWVPSMMTEAWILRALFPYLPESSTCLDQAASPICIECLSDPKTTLLGKKPKLVRRRNRIKNGRSILEVKTDKSAYLGIRDSISQAWPDLVDNLWSAARLQRNLTQALPIT